MDETTNTASRLGLEVVTAGFAGADATGMRDAIVRVIQSPNPLTEANPAAQTPETLAIANAIHLVYGTGNVAKRAIEWLAACRNVPVEVILGDLGREFLEDS